MIGDLLELVDLGDKRDAYVQTLSRGMQQRLCLAHALVHDPQVLLLDEPASGLDPRARVELRELLRELRSLGKTIVISSHILPELEELCTSVAIVDRGQVLAQGRVADIERAAALRGRPARPAPARGRGARGGARLVRGRSRRRVGDDPARRHDRARVPRRRRRRPPDCSPTSVAAACRSSASPARRATSRSSSSRSPPASASPIEAALRDRATDDRRHRAGRSRPPDREPAPAAAPARRPRSPLRDVPAHRPAGSARSASRSSAAGCAAGGRS